MRTYQILLLLFCCTLVHSQEGSRKFNLGFDDHNPDEELPTGWFKWGTYELEVDSLNGNRKQVMKITSDEEGKEFGSVAYRIPANYIGDSIQLSGYMKIEDVTEESSSGLLMRIDGKGKRNILAFDNMHTRKINGTVDWKKYTVTLPFPAESESIYVAGILSGKGTAWFDDFQVHIDGEDIQNLKEVEKPDLFLDKKSKNKLKRLFRKSHISIDLETEKKLDESLNSLVEDLGDKKIVAIGEDTHGTSEYYLLREAITKKLITEKGFNVVILENPYDDIEMMTRNWRKVHIDTLMRRNLFSIYQTKEMKSFLEWLKLTDKNNEIRFTGSDDSYWVLTELMKEKVAELEDRDISDLFRRLHDAATMNVQNFNEKYPNLEQKPANENDLGALVYQTSYELEEMLLSKDLLDDMFREHIFQLKTSYLNYDNLKSKKPITSRDEVMARRIKSFAEDPNAKIIVWAHNAHITNSAVIDNEIGKMGEELKKEFGAAYHSIGMSSFTGSYSYIENRFVNGDHDYSDKLLEAHLMYQPESSWENLFSQVKGENYYLELNKLKDRAGDIGNVDHLKLLGYSKESETDYYQLNPFNMFDTLFFIRESNATTPLFN